MIKSNSQIYCCHERVALSKAYNYYQRRELSGTWFQVLVSTRGTHYFYAMHSPGRSGGSSTYPVRSFVPRNSSMTEALLELFRISQKLNVWDLNLKGPKHPVFRPLKSLDTPLYTHPSIFFSLPDLVLSAFLLPQPFFKSFNFYNFEP